MGGAIARGLAGKGFDVAVANPSRPKLDALVADCPGVFVTTSNREAASMADIVILAVKPWKLTEVITGLQPVAGGRTFVSIAAGVSCDDLSAMFLPGCPAVHCAMPNTAVSVGRGMTFVVSPEPDTRVMDIFAALGDVMLIEPKQMGAAMAVASCGIAYALRYVRAAVEGAVELGLRADDACRIVCRTVEGAAALLAVPGAHPESEIDKVTTPGGVTIRGLNAMEAAGFTPAVIAGLKASTVR